MYAAAAGAVQFLGLDLLGVDGEDRSGAVAFARQRAVAYPLAYDDGGLLYGRISLRVLPPTTAFVRTAGSFSRFHSNRYPASCRLYRSSSRSTVIGTGGLDARS